MNSCIKHGIIPCIFVLLFLALPLMLPRNVNKTSSVALILPIEHPAMNAIAEGFSRACKEYLQRTVDIKQAYGDATLRRALIEQCSMQYNVIAAVGTTVAQELLSSNFNGTCITLAASVQENDFGQKKGVIIFDEVTAEEQLSYIKQLIPNLKHLTLLCSNSEKVTPEIEMLRDCAVNFGINLQVLMVNTLTEMSFTLNHAFTETEGILILKDLIIVNALPTIIDFCNCKSLPLFCSDEGSVRNGATCALGVSEESIGYEGGKQFAQLQKDITPVIKKTIDKRTLYVNNTTREYFDEESIIEIARMYGHELILINRALHA